METRLKLLFIAPDLSIGGLQNHLVRLCNGLADQFHHEIDLVLMSSDCTLQSRLRPEIRVKIFNRRFKSLGALWQVRRLAVSLGPDIIIGWGLYPSMCVAALKLAGVRSRFVATELSNPPAAYGFDERTSVRGLLFLFSMAWSDVATANSPEAVAYIQKRIPVARCVRVYNPISPGNDVPTEPGLVHRWRGAAHRLITIGRLSNHAKGFDILLKACSKLRERELDFHLLLVGDGRDRRELEDLTAALGLHDRITFFGSSERPEQLLQAAEVFILSSNYEGSPNALIEAMMVGKVVVSTTYGEGATEVITDGVSGFLSPPRRPDALAEAIFRACSLSDPGRRTMGTLARERVQQFESSHAVNHYNGVLLDVMTCQPTRLRFLSILTGQTRAGQAGARQI